MKNGAVWDRMLSSIAILIKLSCYFSCFQYLESHLFVFHLTKDLWSEMASFYFDSFCFVILIQCIGSYSWWETVAQQGQGYRCPKPLAVDSVTSQLPSHHMPWVLVGTLVVSCVSWAGACWMHGFTNKPSLAIWEWSPATHCFNFKHWSHPSASLSR